jgi:tRNA1Val (adenine37-N6)-methyltransferase
MANDYFHFKQFSIFQDQCAMKVGTDGVLLGAWVGIENIRKILDIGTGTGLIALMLAQRTDAYIDAIEIDKAAADQAKENVDRSPWTDRVWIHHTSLQEYFPRQSEYDLIISNPPYFSNRSGKFFSSREIARQNYVLNMEELIEGTCRLLNKSGKLALIYPSESFHLLFEKLRDRGMHALRITRVIPTPGYRVKRILAEFVNGNAVTATDDLIIEDSGRHGYSERYRHLTKDFYLDGV